MRRRRMTLKTRHYEITEKKRTPSWWLKKLRKQETLLRLLAAWTSCETVKFVEVEIEEEEEEEKDDDDDDDEGGGGGGVM